MLFYFKCIFMHFALIGFLWLSSWYKENLMDLLPSWAKWIVAFIYLVLLIIILSRSDLITFNNRFKMISNFSNNLMPASLFYTKVVFYYGSIFGLPVILLLYKRLLPLFILAYLTLVFLVILVTLCDYAFPSYSRYCRLFGERKWRRMVEIDDESH